MDEINKYSSMLQIGSTLFVSEQAIYFNVCHNMTILTGKVNWCGQLDKSYIIVEGT